MDGSLLGTQGVPKTKRAKSLGSLLLCCVIVLRGHGRVYDCLSTQAVNCKASVMDISSEKNCDHGRRE